MEYLGSRFRSSLHRHRLNEVYFDPWQECPLRVYYVSLPLIQTKNTILHVTSISFPDWSQHGNSKAMLPATSGSFRDEKQTEQVPPWTTPKMLTLTYTASSDGYCRCPMNPEGIPHSYHSPLEAPAALFVST